MANVGRKNKNFKTQCNKLQNEFGEDMTYLNGFSEDQLNDAEFVDNFVDEPVVGDMSVDPSSNVSKRKDMVTLLTEMPKPRRKVLAFQKVYYEMQKAYGFNAANEWLRREWIGEIYMHDADTCTFKSYCFAYTLKDLAEKGLYFMEESFNEGPAQHLEVFVDFVKEFINFASNRTSGAVGLPDLIPYMYYFWIKDQREEYLGINQWEKYARQQIQRFIYAVNQPCVRDGQQSAFTNTSVFDREYLMALFGGSQFPDGSDMVDHIEGIMKFQKMYMEVMAAIRSVNMFTFPVSSISLVRKDGEFKDEEFAEWAIKHNMQWSDSNLFIDDDVSSLSNCCRLKSNIRDLGYFNSIGGTALKVGSVKVNTINLARLALDTNTKEEYIEELKNRTLCVVRSLHVIRHIIKRNVEKGLLPNFSYKLIDFEHLYNTIGFIGIYETMKKFGCTYQDKLGNTYYTQEAADFGKQIFETIRNVADEFLAQGGYDYKINTEQIPGENAAAKLMKKDQFFYPDANIYDLPLYGNQFMPLGIKATLQERVRVQAMFDGFCNGGSILHANIDAPFNNYEVARKMVEYIADRGVTYFAFNTKIQACEDNHGFYGTTCPVCGKPIATEYTRIVGFITATKTWTKPRKAEYPMRKWEPTEKIEINLGEIA